ncbi:(2Fe-2S)-binding protein [Sinorhizobium sp. 6-70]|nr:MULTISPECIES: (2Fe-2S)-binding protein [unclassified Sinorhizobium]MDK1378159.1 (2Fe-2S)-binding protein [Sinorhizobium sp. 6-70]MDK1479792.1 (2Fe-2S)-binding protein [Sinorhizobium sp. 6-117]
MSAQRESIEIFRTVPLCFQGDMITAKEGEPVAAAILATHPDFTGKSPVSGRRRSPYCMMGLCFECLMEIDGIPNQRACVASVRMNMTVRKQIGTRSFSAGSK